jgi:hypothetical protein
MNIEVLNNIIKHTDEMNKNIEKCISNGIEFYLHEKKINGLKLEYHMDNKETYISIALTYNGKGIDLEDKEKSAKEKYLWDYLIFLRKRQLLLRMCWQVLKHVSNVLLRIKYGRLGEMHESCFAIAMCVKKT